MTKIEKSKSKQYSVIVNGVVVKNGKILLAQRSMEEKHVPGCWSPPGGKLEEDTRTWHSLEKATKREVLEETGVEVEDKMHFLVNNTFRHDEDNLLVIATVFLCKWKSGEPKPLEDTIAARWITEEEVDDIEFTHSNVKDYIVKAFQYLKKI